MTRSIGSGKAGVGATDLTGLTLAYKSNRFRSATMGLLYPVVAVVGELTSARR